MPESFKDKIQRLAKENLAAIEKNRIAREAAALLQELDPAPTVPMLPPPLPVENQGAENEQPSDRQQRTEEDSDDFEGSDTDDEVIQYQGTPAPLSIAGACWVGADDAKHVYRTEVQTKPSAARPVRPRDVPLRRHWDTIEEARELIQASLDWRVGSPGLNPEWIAKAKDWLEYTG